MGYNSRLVGSGNVLTYKVDFCGFVGWMILLKCYQAFLPACLTFDSFLILFGSGVF